MPKKKVTVRKKSHALLKRAFTRSHRNVGSGPESSDSDPQSTFRLRKTLAKNMGNEEPIAEPMSIDNALMDDLDIQRVLMQPYVEDPVIPKAVDLGKEALHGGESSDDCILDEEVCTFQLPKRNTAGLIEFPKTLPQSALREVDNNSPVPGPSGLQQRLRSSPVDLAFEGDDNDSEYVPEENPFGSGDSTEEDEEDADDVSLRFQIPDIGLDEGADAENQANDAGDNANNSENSNHQAAHDEQLQDEADDVFHLDLDFLVESFQTVIESHPGMSKSCAIDMWALFRNLLNNLTPYCPASIREAYGDVPTYYTILRKYAKEYPKCRMDFVIEDLEKEMDSPERIIKLTEQDKFPRKRYGGNKYKLVHELTYFPVKETYDFMRIRHEIGCDNMVPVILGIDGVPEARSNSVSLAVAHMAIKPCHAKPIPMIVSRSKVSNKYMTYYEVMERLYKECLAHDIPVAYIIADKPCRAAILYQRNPPSPSTCEYCWQVAVTFRYVKLDRYGKETNKKGTKKTFIYDHTCVLKTQESILQVIDNPNALREEQGGYYGRTCLIDTLPLGVPMDYMHGQCLGNIKRLLSLLISIPGNDSIKKCFLTVPMYSMGLLNEGLSQVRCPSDFNRMIRNFDFANLKAEELRNYGLFFFLILIKASPSSDIRRQVLIRYMYLFRSFLCLDDLDLEKAREHCNLRELALQFEKAFISSFGQYHVVYTVHTIHHLEELRQLGPLTETSAFPAESMFGSFLRGFTSGTTSVAKQGMNYVLERYGSGRHRCRKRIVYKPYTGNQKVDDSLAYTRSIGGQYKFWKIIESDLKLKKCKAVEFACTRCFFHLPELPRGLNMSMCGIFRRLPQISDVPREFLFKEFHGKLIQIDDFIATCPLPVLYEST